MGVALGALLFLGAPAARASEAADKAMAQRLLTQGNQLVGDGDYINALEKFKAAYAKFPSPKILLNIGSTLRQLGRNVEAAEVYEQYIKDPKNEPAKVPGAQRVLGEIDAVIGRLTIEVSQPAARVRLDGKVLPGFENGGVIRVEPGDHSVVAEKEGFPDAVQTLRVGPHDEKVVTLKIALPEKVIVERTVDGPQETISYIVGGVGAAGLLGGAIAGGIAIAKNKAAAAHCEKSTGSTSGSSAHPVPCDQTGVDLGKTAKSSATASTVLLAVGGGALATGVVLFLTAPSKKPDAPKVGLFVSPFGASATLEGSW